MKNLIKKLLLEIYLLTGYDFNIRIEKTAVEHGIHLIIGAGDYIIRGFRSLDVYTPHYYKNFANFQKTRVSYDMRKDRIPFKCNSVDNIYCSHVIEHLEDKHVGFP